MTLHLIWVKIIWCGRYFQDSKGQVIEPIASWRSGELLYYRDAIILSYGLDDYWKTMHPKAELSMYARGCFGYWLSTELQ